MLPKALKAKQGSVVNKKYDTFYKLNRDVISNYRITDKQQEIIDLFETKDKVIRKEIWSKSVNMRYRVICAYLSWLEIKFRI